ncbi:MAG: glycosyltransferase family 4 protein [Anaerolineales bacterium]|jgi:hypothetical protein
MKITPSRIGFVSTRFVRGDSVTSETEKWVGMLDGMGHECFFFSGESDRDPDRSMIVPEAGSEHPDIANLRRLLFDEYKRTTKISGLVHALRFHLKQNLYQFIRTFDINLLIIENALSLPNNIPLGLALTETIAETGLPTIVHHYDFAWYRSRYSVTSAEDYLRTAFPPALNNMYHVVTNSLAAQQLALRTGSPSRIIPYVMDFDNPPEADEEYAQGLLTELGIENGRTIVLQPTNIAARKRIELSIDLTERIADNAVLLITKQPVEREMAYKNRLQEYADSLGVEVIFGSEHIHHSRGPAASGGNTYSVSDAYRIADVVSYPTTLEGFGHAFLEGIYHKRLMLVSKQPLYRLDIEPRGFMVLSIDHFIDDETVTRARSLLTDTKERKAMVEHNYEIGRTHFSYHSLVSYLSALLDEILGA